MAEDSRCPELHQLTGGTKRQAFLGLREEPPEKPAGAFLDPPSQREGVEINVDDWVLYRPVTGQQRGGGGGGEVCQGARSQPSLA